MKELEKAVLAVMQGKSEEQVDEAKKPLHPNQQKLDVHEPEKDELTAKDFEMLRSGKKAKMKEETEKVEEEVTEIEYTFSDYLQVAKAKFGADDAVKIANEAYTKKDISLFSSHTEA